VVVAGMAIAVAVAILAGITSLRKGKCILKGEVMFIGNVQRLQMLFVAMTHLVEVLIVEILLMLKAEKPLAFLVVILASTASIIEQRSVLFSEMLINKISRFCRLVQSILKINNSTLSHNCKMSWVE
jgi:hypothetical protein